MPPRAVAITLLLLVGVGGACSDNTPTSPSETAAVTVTETFEGALSVNGARTHPFTVDRSGDVTARLTFLSEQTATVGLSLGTWNGATCAVILANDTATIGVSIVGTAQATGEFCVRINDTGFLTSTIDYIIDVAHF